MLRGEFASAAEQGPAALEAAYFDRLRETITEFGFETVAHRSGIDDVVLQAIADGDRPELTLEAAAAVLSVDPDLPPGDAVAAEARDIILMGMTTAVVDVDAVAAGVDLSLDPKEIQQKIEGRHPITLAEYAHVQAFLEA